MSAAKLKRFYETVSVEPAAEGFLVHLDAAPLRSPEKNELLLPDATIAEALATEWRAQTEEIAPQTMPLTKLAFTATDRVRPNREAVIEQIAALANSDVICYRASEPKDLVARQSECWDPMLEWAESALGASLKTGEGIGYVAQDYEALCALTEVFSDQTDFYLSALYAMASNINSLVIALAVAEEEIDVENAFQSANCDAHYQSEKWGSDSEAQALFDARLDEFKTAASFILLLQGLARSN